MKKEPFVSLTEDGRSPQDVQRILTAKYFHEFIQLGKALAEDIARDYDVKDDSQRYLASLVLERVINSACKEHTLKQAELILEEIRENG